MTRLPPAMLGLAAVLTILGPRTVGAQVRASERATITQVVDGTTLTIDHARPRVRDRTQIFGKTVQWDEVWTPGANWATTLKVSRDITLDGHPVAAGTWSVWFVVRPQRWTVVLDPKAQRYHTEAPDSSAEQVRWDVIPTPTPMQEILSWSFPEVRPDGAKLRFEWADRRVTLDAAVQPSHPLPIARAVAEPYLGTYAFRWDDEPSPDTMRITLSHDGTMLRQRYTPFPDWYPRLQDQPMVHLGETYFIAAIIRDGQVWEMVADMVFEFKVVNGRATGFEIRDDRDHLIATGWRVDR